MQIQQNENKNTHTHGECDQKIRSTAIKMISILCKSCITKQTHNINKSINRYFNILSGNQLSYSICKTNERYLLRNFTTTTSTLSASTQSDDNVKKDKTKNGKLGTNILSNVFTKRKKLPTTPVNQSSNGQIDLYNGPEITSTEVVKAMMAYIWPKDNEMIRRRVALSLGLLVGSKAINVCVPFLFKAAVDNLNILSTATVPDTSLTICTSIILGYGIARLSAAGFSELRNSVFAQVAQHSIRKIATNVFMHMHNLDLRFHLNRQTGAINKAIDRGSRGINFVLTAMVFNVVPTIFELALVSTILGVKCGPAFASISLACVGIYAAFTLGITSWRTKFRVYMNKAENQAGNI